MSLRVRLFQKIRRKMKNSGRRGYFAADAAFAFVAASVVAVSAFSTRRRIP
jgi:hypothetical protein